MKKAPTNIPYTSVVKVASLVSGMTTFASAVAGEAFGVVVAVISTASAIAAVTPTPKAGSFLAKAYNIIDILALNIGKAKDK